MGAMADLKSTELGCPIRSCMRQKVTSRGGLTTHGAPGQ
ncbi:unnamed protein product [Staurois parvus]|uniref:Uncharacterized protein n=1 Tax=Staurois parvus TaxID=386267 RepID=A0ABN9DJL2_9NEOB|nr:unnamed protein product [Staurois parvus]